MAHAGPGPDVQVVAVDASRYPVVAIDIAVPTHELAGALPAEAFSVAGASELSVARLDPADIAVALVLDDRADVSPEAVAGEEGGAVEFVRALDPGTLVGVSSPGGVLAAASGDKAAQMSAVESVRSHPLPASNQLVPTLIDSATRLAATPSTRRVLVALVALGSVPDRPVADLRAALAVNRVQLHVVSIGAAPDPDLVAVAIASGGTTTATDPAGLIAALDAVSGPLTGRYRLTAKVAGPGPHAVRVTFGIATSLVNVNVATPSVPPTSRVPATQVGTPGPSPTSVAATAAPPAAPTSRATVATAPTAPVRASSSAGTVTRRARTGLIAAVAVSVAVAVAVAAAFYRRRLRRRRPRAARSSGAGSATRSLAPAPARPTMTASTPPARSDEPTDPTGDELTLATVSYRAARDHAPQVIEETLEFAHLRVWPCRRTVTSAERPVTLTAREFDVLELFMRRPERLLTPDDIAVAVWPTGTSPHPSTVVACVGAMRRKLETHGESRLVHTVRGAGYVLEEDVSPGPHPRPIELERRGRDYGRIS